MVWVHEYGRELDMVGKHASLYGFPDVYERIVPQYGELRDELSSIESTKGVFDKQRRETQEMTE
jgi:hypothetical protein